MKTSVRQGDDALENKNKKNAKSWKRASNACRIFCVKISDILIVLIYWSFDEEKEPHVKYSIQKRAEIVPSTFKV